MRMAGRAQVARMIAGGTQLLMHLDLRADSLARERPDQAADLELVESILNQHATAWKCTKVGEPFQARNMSLLHGRANCHSSACDHAPESRETAACQNA